MFCWLTLNVEFVLSVIILCIFVVHIDFFFGIQLSGSLTHAHIDRHAYKIHAIYLCIIGSF